MNKAFKYNFGPKTKPFPHQLEAINFIESNETVALFDEQGLGKTKIVIEALCNNINTQIINGALIICRKNLIQNWKEEIETHSYLKSIVLRGTPKVKGVQYMGFAHFYLINYESVKGELERLKMFLKIKKLAIVLDESHAIKNPDSISTKAILELSTLASKKIIVSGTPVANKPEDLWSQFYFLDQGTLLGKDFSNFKSHYKIDFKNAKAFSKTDELDRLREKISIHSIRRKKNEVLELPEKKYFDEYVDLEGRQLEMYEQLKEELYLEVMNMDGEVVIDRSDDILKKILRLEQIASNPGLVDSSYTETPAKLPRLEQLVKEIIGRNEKVIIWSCFVENILYLNKLFKSYGSQMIYGDIPIDRRNSTVKKFREDENYKVLIANPAAAKEGLTLTSANNAIYLDRNFNLVDYLQSQDRIHRISQERICNIIKIIARNTIDEYIEEIINRKHYLAMYIQGDHDKLDFSETLTKDEILNFIGGNYGKNQN